MNTKTETETVSVSEVEKITNGVWNYFKNPKTAEFDKIVAEYVTNTGNSPFANIEMKEDGSGELMLDMDASFTTEVEDKFGGELNDIISDYFVALVEVMKNELESGEFEFPENSENSENDIKAEEN